MIPDLPSACPSTAIVVVIVIDVVFVIVVLNST